MTLDACVIYPISTCDLLLHVAETGLFSPVWSAEIMQEVSRTSLRFQSSTGHQQVMKRLADMNEAFPSAPISGSTEVLAALKSSLPDPTDAHVISTAIASRSRFIVTENLRDFPTHVLDPLAIIPISFDKFMVQLWNRDPWKVLAGLETLLEAKTKPTLTLNGYLNQLEKVAPTFIKQVLRP